MLSGTQDTGFAYSILTGDLVSHDAENELSRWDNLLLSHFCVSNLRQRYHDVHRGNIIVSHCRSDTYKLRNLDRHIRFDETPLGIWACLRYIRQP